jgi:hypothetical protein
MMNIFKYRAVAFFLAMTFCLFNVGLPIVVSSCPMVKTANSKTCRMCAEVPQSHMTTVTKTSDRSCCMTIIAAGRNTTEFLQVKSSANDLTSSSAIVVRPIVLQSVNVSFNDISLLYSPPLSSEDISLLTSSLLI